MGKENTGSDPGESGTGEETDDTRTELGQGDDDPGGDAPGGDGGESDDDGGDEQLRDPGKRALDRIKEQRNKLRQEADDLRKKVKEYEDRDKSETQRLQEAAEEAKQLATSAEQTRRKLQVALDRAPAHASLAQVKAVAKRVSGESDDDLADDADELFTLIAPEKSTEDSRGDGGAGVKRKPREALRGGGDPDNSEPEESRPNKLADLIGRH